MAIFSRVKCNLLVGKELGFARCAGVPHFGCETVEFCTVETRELQYRSAKTPVPGCKTRGVYVHFGTRVTSLAPKDGRGIRRTWQYRADRL